MAIHKIWKSLVFLSILGVEGDGYRLHVDPMSVNSPLMKNNNLVTSERKAKEILFRYGYLRCYPRRLKQVLTASNNPKYKYCGRRLMREAVTSYQRNYNLPPTGKIDDATLKHMSMSRCGNPDLNTSSLARHHIRHSRNHRHPNSIPILHYRKKRETVSKSASKANNASIHNTLIGTVISRRRTWLHQYLKKLDDEEHRDINKTHHKMRRKRYATRHRNKEILNSKLVRWRLVSSAYSNQMPVKTQRAALALAFRMWSEVIPMIFLEDTKSPVHDIDVLLAFGKGEHLNCPNSFDGYGGQLSHAVNMEGNSEIHVDDDEFLTIGSIQGINLVRLAVHEVGHALGFHHIPRNRSIMHSVYSEGIPSNNFELDWEDRRMAQNAYGVCKGHFDTVFDFVRRSKDGKLIYNTYFFRENICWMYENRHRRPRYGDPRYISVEWRGLPTENIDGYAHIWTPTQNKAYFFKGRHYWLYDSQKDKAAFSYPRNISTDFGPISGSPFPHIPSHLDTVYFDKRDGNLYFFKGSMVYGYDVSRGHHGCCLPGYPKHITKAFPSSSPKSSLPGNLDAAYFSYTDHTVYFFKGNQYWKNVGFNLKDNKTLNRIDGPWEVSSKWQDICEVEL